MSPIPSGTNAFALLATTAVVDNSGQPPPTQSQDLLGTGGILVAVVAIVSIVAYFLRRGTAKGSGTSHSWVSSWSGLFNTLRHCSSDTACNEVTSRRAPADIEAGLEHVSMVYARHFHPTCWNPVEWHPPTPSAPAICVEEETQEPQVSEPTPFGMNSFLDVDDDDDDDGDNNVKCAPEGSRRDERPKSKRLPPYHINTSINVTFTSDVIGSTARAGGFLHVPGEPDEELSNEETSSSDADTDFYCSPFDGTLTLPPGSSCSLQQYDESPLDFDSDCYCSAYGGILVTQPEPCCIAKRLGQVSSGPDLEFDFSLTNDGIMMETPTSGSQVEVLLPYDMPAETNVNLSNGTTGTRARPLPAIPVQLEDTLSESSSFGSDSDFPCSPYAGIETTPPMPTRQVEDHPVYDATPSMFSGQIFGAMDRLRPLSIILEESEEELSQSSGHDFEYDHSCLPLDGISLMASSSSLNTRRYGVADMDSFAESPMVAPPEEVVTISHSPGLLNLSEFTEAERAMSCTPDQVEPVENPTTSCSDASAQDGHDRLRENPSHDAMPAAAYEGPEIIRRLLEELRDFELYLETRSLSEDSDSESEYSDCGDDGDDSDVPDLVDSSDHDNSRRHSLESISSIPVPDSEVSTEGPIYPLTPTIESAISLTSAPGVDGVHKAPLDMAPSTEEVRVASPRSSDSPPSLPSKAYIRARRDSRSLWYGPRIPLVALPRL